MLPYFLIIHNKDRPCICYTLPMSEERIDKENNTAPETGSSGMSPEKFAAFFKDLSDDVILDMLQNAGLPADALPDDEPPEPCDADPSPAEVQADPAPAKPKKRRIRKKRKFLLLLIAAGIILIPVAINVVFMNVTLNSNDPIKYSEQTDSISCMDGVLIVNEVNVSVPTDGSEQYSISYAWAENDDKYPSVPHAITANYSDQEGNSLYSISLYRNDSVPSDKIPKGKTADNWFDDWEEGSGEGISQVRLRANGSINGFYISPDAADETSDYNNYSYYFAVSEGNGISIYVIEGVCLDAEQSEGFPAIMDSCIKSISLK